MNNPHILISGGGTGGHIFPALAIAQALRKKLPDAEIKFVGAIGRMEMEKVPAAGFPIEGLPISGFDRKNIFRNFVVVGRLLKSLWLARKIVRIFNPDIAIGVGGYASGPTLWCASAYGAPILIQEQNSYAGVTNKLLARRAQKICVAYKGMERFFPAPNIVLTGNPVREGVLTCRATPAEAKVKWGLDPDKKTVLVIGGSLGARTINQSIAAALSLFKEKEIQLLWQTGKAFDAKAADLVEQAGYAGIKQMPFIAEMDLAYKAADLVISRAGASSISELCLLGKASILVPSPNVSEDHQTKNAQALEREGAAILVTDAEAQEQLAKVLFETIAQEQKIAQLSTEVVKLAFHNSAQQIADIAIDLMDQKRQKK